MRVISRSTILLATLLFGVTALPALAQPAALPVSSATVIHPGDQINVQVFGEQTLTQNVTVLSDGSIEYPLVGRLDVAGRTPTQAASLLSQRLQKYVRHPVVTVAITQLGQPNVLVLGAVKNPGKYQLRSDARLSDAIAAAGGLGDTNGEYPVARVSSSDGQVSQVNLQDLLRQGKVNLDQRVGEGSVVYVPGPVAMTVHVSGAVDHPGDIQVFEGDRLAVAIAKAGNSMNAQADLNHIRVIRRDPAGQQQTMQIDLYKALENGDSAADVALQKDDTIFVPQAKQKLNILNMPLLYLLGHLIPTL